MTSEAAPPRPAASPRSGLAPAAAPAPRSGRVISLGVKAAGVTIALMAVVTVLVCIGLTSYQRESLLRAKESAAAAVARLFADSCAAPIVFSDTRAVSDALTTLGRNEEVAYAAVWGLDGHDGIGEKLGELSRGRPVEMLTASEGVELRREPERIVVLVPVRDPDARRVGAAVVTLSLDRENAAIADILRRTLFICAAIAAGITALLLAIARVAIVRPLGQLLVAANEIERGLASDIDIHSNDEIGQLATAFRSMATAIRQREERIEARNRDMRLVLDNVGQGFLTLDVKGRLCEERSRIVDQWFGPPQAGAAFADYLRQIDPKQAQWFEIGWASIEDDIMPLDLCIEQLPRLVQRLGSVYELAYQAILQGERLDKLVVVITDVTARVERERAEVAQRDTMGIFQRMLSDRAAFEEFFGEASALIAVIEQSDGANGALLKRAIHTLKGNCAIFGIASVASFCHELESQLEEEGTRLTPESKQALSSLWASVTQVRSQFTHDGSVVVDGEEYRAFLVAVRARADHDVLAARFGAWQLEPAAKRLTLIAEQIKQLAARLGKPDVDVRLEPTTLRLPPKKWSPFWSAFAHVIRNAVDHGLETPEERAATGKPMRAAITLSIACEAREVVVAIADDGRGVDWLAIAERARELGLAHDSAADLEVALFAQGVSSRTEVTTTSGRGVGLSAVRDAVAQLGGRIAVHAESGAGTVFRFYLPVAMLADDVASLRASSTPPGMITSRPPPSPGNDARPS